MLVCSTLNHAPFFRTIAATARFDWFILVEAEARAHHAFDAQSAGYRAGVVDLTALLTAERTWRNARTSLSALRATTLSDAVNVFKALGGGWTPLDPNHPVTSFPDQKP